jgi:sterol desaturase/sphingolipid hydroxylase (fatty acid hydroxylase superfamily)
MTLKERLDRFRSFWIFPFLSVVLLYAASKTEPHRAPSDLLWLFPLGLVIWTLLEYFIHRFLFHIRMPLRNARLREIVNVSHLGHHASPRDPTKVLVQTPFGIAISALLFGLLYATTRSVFSSAGMMVGIWAGFLYYEAVHYRVHFSLSGTGLVAWQRRAHFYHHFTNNKRCFGVTSPVWDYVFRTTRITSSAPPSL